ncbi:Dihydrolipoyl dehydrogenase [uncultured Desulfobacterium sp.]|uniref:Dihydrolipoyl dehydrogenase n=1 Tax=uncultured Desulfobacterium sp. TaxID=201089 RepID=A0A445N3R2_9BACT|nr:Dihydrolipoyl dehydrogenase [uncultured Desulfobacterium sp.]
MQGKYDIVFLGGGPAGYQGAIRAAQLGAKVAVVEEQQVGGVCLNRGCIPTKTVRASVEVGRLIRRAREYGFRAVEVSPDIAAIVTRKNRIVKGLRTSVERLFSANKIDLIPGRGVLLNPCGIEVKGAEGSQLIEAAKVVIATGSNPETLPIFPESPHIFTADAILDIGYLPKHLLVVGGGAIGVEMAAIFRELGSHVTLVEAEASLLPSEDAEMVAYLMNVLKRRKINVRCNVTVESVGETIEGFIIRLTDGTDLVSDTIIQAVGRRLNTDGIGLEGLGVETSEGRIIVNENLETNVAGIYAAGDVIGGWLLAHVAFFEGICAAENALGKTKKIDYRVVPRCIFSLPEYAAVGISEEEARPKNSVRVGRFPFKSLGMAQAMGEMEGLVKIIMDTRTDRILGAHIIGPHASDMIAETALAMRADLPSSMIEDTIHAHPTLSEAVLEVAQALHGRAIHIPEQVEGAFL